MGKQYLTWVLLPVVCAVGCFQCSFSTGATDGPLAPWTFRTQYGFWDSTYYETTAGYTDSSAAMVLRQREDTPEGESLFLMFFGMVFDYHRDARSWNASEETHFRNGFTTQPIMFIQVSHAENLAPGDVVEYDSEAAPGQNGYQDDVSATRLAVYYQPGSGLVQPWSDYPEEFKPFGSRVKAKLRLQTLPRPPLLGVFTGTLNYSFEKGSNDPADVRTGEFNTAFSAELLKERIAECNYVAYFYSAYYYLVYYPYLAEGCSRTR